MTHTTEEVEERSVATFRLDLLLYEQDENAPTCDECQRPRGITHWTANSLKDDPEASSCLVLCTLCAIHQLIDLARDLGRFQGVAEITVADILGGRSDGA